MKIALIGTTPIIIIKALLLSKENDVTIFEGSKKLGGAWSFGKYKDISYPEKTNVIVPNNKNEEKFIYKIKKYLNKNFKMKIVENKKKYSNKNDYKPKKVFIFDLKKIFLKLKNSNIKIKKKWVKSLKIKKNKVIINSKFIYDQVNLPFFIKLDTAIINKKKYNFSFNEKFNKHIQFITKKFFTKEFYYGEDYNKFFDRTQLLKKEPYFLFTARIKKLYKHFSKEKLFKLSDFKIKRKDLIKLKLIEYTHHYRDKKQIKQLIKLNQFKEINIIDTNQFVSAFKKLKII